MNFVIKNPAPTTENQQRWGDYHFGQSLSKYLTRMGHTVSTQYDIEWKPKKCDVALVLRGKYEYPQIKDEKAVKVMWNISHPDAVSDEEYKLYDMVLVASEKHADELNARLHIHAVPFLQCTDHEQFNYIEKDDEKERRDIIFVGNTRGVSRDCVNWAADYSSNLKIWGRGWEAENLHNLVVSRYIMNEELGQLYNYSRATLNDHWQDMIDCQFINNRIFDALACGLPVITDYHESLHRLFPTELLYYRDNSELLACFKKIMFNYPTILGNTNKARKIVLKEYTFEKRAKDLVSMLNRM